MQQTIILHAKDIHEAICLFLAAKGVTVDQTNLDIDYKVTRKGENKGLSATITSGELTDYVFGSDDDEDDEKSTEEQQELPLETEAVAEVSSETEFVPVLPEETLVETTDPVVSAEDLESL